MNEVQRKEYLKEYMKRYRVEHRAELRARKRKWRGENRESYNARQKEQIAKDVNSAGVPKNRIRTLSRYVLFKNHAKFPDYEIHHCFGYEDQNKFIYIPRTLHQMIHQLLRDNNIPADSNHWYSIRDLVNSWEGYTYIRS